MKVYYALVLAIGLASPLTAQNATLTTPQIQAASADALNNGRPREAAALADIILSVRPENVTALMLRARASLDLQDFDAAKALSKRAYRLTDDPNTKYLAARIAAVSHAEKREDSRAQLWLRFARQYAPNDQEAALVATDYRAVAQRNPWSSSLRFGVSPSSNINNGTEADSILLRGVPFAFKPGEDARPLSGLEISLGFSTRYRMNVTETSATFFDIGVYGRTYALSPDSKDKVPEAKGSDYSDASLRFGITYRQILFEGQQPTTFSAQVSETWYSGDPFTRNLDFNVSHDWIIGERSRVGVTAAAQTRESLESDPTVQVYRLGTNWTQILENSDQLTMSAQVGQSRSDTFDQDYDSLTLSANYSFAEPFMDMRFSLGGSVEQREFDATDYGNGTRSDLRKSVNMRVQFTELEIYGFQPVATVAATRNESDADLFDREYVNFGFDLQSSF